MDAVVASAISTPNEVLEGAVIKAVWVEIWITAIGTESQTAAFNFSLEKIPAAATKMTNAQSTNLHVYPNKKNILYVTQGNVRSQGSNPVPLLRQWFAIPKGKQRFGLGDELILNLSNVGAVSVEVCGIYTYKEYR